MVSPPGRESDASATLRNSIAQVLAFCYVWIKFDPLHVVCSGLSLWLEFFEERGPLGLVEEVALFFFEGAAGDGAAGERDGFDSFWGKVEVEGVGEEGGGGGEGGLEGGFGGGRGEDGEGVAAEGEGGTEGVGGEGLGEEEVGGGGEL